MPIPATDLYVYLKEAYDEVLRRRSFLSDRAGTLIGFDGVAAAILTGFVGTNRVATILLVPLALSLLFFLGSTLSAILAIWEKEWYLVPTLPDVDKLISKASSAISSRVSAEGLVLQVIKATELNEIENWRKYAWLRYGYIFLTLAVTLSTIIGILAVFPSSSEPW